jgi:integrase
MPYAKVPAFFEQLRGSDTMAARALQLLILTACRTSEVLKATWDEFEFESRIWTLSAERMKSKRDHRVPLSGTALAILQPLRDARVSGYVFPGQKPNKSLSDMAMEMLMKRMAVKNASPHGFRSSFRDWAGDCTSFPREIAEQALAHKVGDETELAYRRGDALEKRRQLMQAWADFCDGKASQKIARLVVG